MAYAEDEPEPEKKTLMFFGTDLSKIPCFRNSFLYSIGSGMLVGVAYNLATSRNPYRLAFGTYTAVLFGYYGICRYNFRQSEHEMKLLREAMRLRPTVEGTESDEQWAASQINKRTEVRNFRSDIKEDDA